MKFLDYLNEVLDFDIISYLKVELINLFKKRRKPMAYDKAYYQNKLIKVNQQYVKKLEEFVADSTNRLQALLNDKAHLAEEAQEVMTVIAEQEAKVEKPKEGLDPKEPVSNPEEKKE